MAQELKSPSLPIVDLKNLRDERGMQAVAAAIGAACQEFGFFYVVNHGIETSLQTMLEQLSMEFFRLSQAEKMQIAMANGGRAWRGYFPVGNELTSGQPDLKEGIYFGAELAEQHPMVVAAQALHGRNLFPQRPVELRSVVLSYMAAMTELGHRLMGAISLSLGLDSHYFHQHYTGDPLTLFRIFHYPAPGDAASRTRWGVGEHTDYGVLTILKQDACGGLEVKTKSGWLAAPPIAGTFVCNIGDMLDRMTGGLYRSTPHRVRNVSGRSRLSFPFFFDPNFNAEVRPLPVIKPEAIQDDAARRWDRSSVHAYQGTYGQYLLGKVGKVFPDLKAKVLPR